MQVPFTELAVKKLLAEAGLAGPHGPPSKLTGGNNQVFLIEGEDWRAVLKAYFHHPDDPRDRFGAETAFSRFLRAGGVNEVPELLSSDSEYRLALYQYVEGVRPDQVGGDDVSKAMEFIGRINKLRRAPEAATLANGSEACWSLEGHLDLVGSRLEQLRSAEHSVRAFIEEEAWPVWKRVREWAGDRAGGILAEVLRQERRCLSPSDFGFHNSLRDSGGNMFFLDFEYSGWDDPARMIADFFCQPEVLVPEDYMDAFADAVADFDPAPDKMRARTEILLTVYRMKWCCISLNEFLPVGRARRLGSATETGSEPGTDPARKLGQARQFLDLAERRL
jgi:hypothetical protein